ncbi:MAG: uncharacterized protein QOC95_120 [Thermoleophilaceae bacterium]|jgi:uncharacterized membrane protein YedE/YeeE|nr:uncharacterized protein [Thermoleophilaceae bacterium]
MRVRAAAALFGAAFGFLISWGQFSDPDRIRDMLLLKDPYLYLMMASSIVVAGTGTWLLRRRRSRALLTGEEIRVERTRPERRHVVGAAIFGVGWAVADSCPAPIAAQLTQGVWWSAFTIAGIGIGVVAFLRRQERAGRRELERSQRAVEPAVAPPIGV